MYEDFLQIRLLGFSEPHFFVENIINRAVLYHKVRLP